LPIDGVGNINRIVSLLLSLTFFFVVAKIACIVHEHFTALYSTTETWRVDIRLDVWTVGRSFVWHALSIAQFDEKLIEFSRVCCCSTPCLWHMTVVGWTTDSLDVLWLKYPSASASFPTSFC